MDGLRQILQLRRGFSGLSDDTHMFACWYVLADAALQRVVVRYPNDTVVGLMSLDALYMTLHHGLQSRPDCLKRQFSLMRCRPLSQTFYPHSPGQDFRECFKSVKP